MKVSKRWSFTPGDGIRNGLTVVVPRRSARGLMLQTAARSLTVNGSHLQSSTRAVVLSASYSLSSSPSHEGNRRSCRAPGWPYMGNKRTTRRTTRRLTVSLDSETDDELAKRSRQAKLSKSAYLRVALNKFWSTFGHFPLG